MDQIYRLKESIFNYLSPAKRRHTIQPLTPDTSTKHQRQPHTEPKGKERAVLAGRVNKNRLSPSDTRRLSRRPTKRYTVDDNRKGAPNFSRLELTPEDSISQIQDDTENVNMDGDAGDEDSFEEFEEEDEVEEELNIFSDHESELSAEAKVENFLEHQETFEDRRRALVASLQQEELSDDEFALFRRIQMRGYEPLMHTSWVYDFRTCPEILFTDISEEVFFDVRGPPQENSNYIGMANPPCSLNLTNDLQLRKLCEILPLWLPESVTWEVLVSHKNDS
jgi:hypothetical protein